MLDLGTTGTHGNGYWYGNQTRMDFTRGYTIGCDLVIPSGRTGTVVNATILSQWDVISSNAHGWALRMGSTDLTLAVIHGSGAGGNDSFQFTELVLEEDIRYSVVARFDPDADTVRLNIYGLGEQVGTGFEKTISSAHSRDLAIGNDGDTPNSGAAVYVGNAMIHADYISSYAEVFQFHLKEVVPAPANMSFFVRGTAEPANDISDFALTGTEQGTVGLFSEATADSAFQGSGIILPHRARAGRGIRMFRMAPQLVTVTVPLEYLSVEIGDTLSIAHGGIPRATSVLEDANEHNMLDSWRAMKAVVFQRRFRSEDREVELTCLNVEPMRCLHWHSNITERFINDEGQGTASVNMGADITNSRNSTHYVVDPAEQSGIVQLAAVSRFSPKTNHKGTVYEIGVENLITNSAFLIDGSGPPAAADWSESLGTGGTVIKQGDTTVPRLFKDAFIQGNDVESLEIKKSTDASDYIEQAVTTGASPDAVRVTFWHRELSDGTGTSWRLQRSSDSQYWNDSTPGWQAGIVWNESTYSETSWVREVSEPIDGIDSDTLTLRIGINAAAASSGDLFYVGQVMLYQHWAILTDFVTLDGATFTSDSDAELWSYDNGGADERQTFNPNQGTYRARLRMVQPAADVPNSTSFAIAEWGIDDNNRDIVALFKNGSGNWSLNYARYISGSLDVSTQASISAWTVGDELEVAVTWTSASGGELGKAARSMTAYVTQGGTTTASDDAEATGNHSTSDQTTQYRIGFSSDSSILNALCYVYDVELLQDAIPPEAILGYRLAS